MAKPIRVIIGRHSYGVNETVVRHSAPGATLTVGAFCSVAEGLTVFLGGNHRMDWVSTFPFAKRGSWPTAPAEPVATGKGSVMIGNDVWIGADVTIMSGITVGDGAVIGARAVVARDIPAYGIAVGNPARVIKYRFSPEDRALLLRIKWWEWSDKLIAKALPLICGASPQALGHWVHRRAKA